MAEKIVYSVDVETEEANSNVEELNENLGKTGKGVKNINDSSKNGSKGVAKLSASFRTLGKATGVVFLINKALEILTEIFGQNQMVVDTFNTAFNALSIAFNDFVKWIGSNIGGITGFFKAIFDDPLASLQKFGNALWDNLVERFYSIIEVAGHVGRVFKSLFAGDFAGAIDAYKDAGKEMIDVFTGVDNSAEKIVEGTKKVVASASEYTKAVVKQAQEMTELNKTAEIAQVINQGLIEQYDRQAEQQRQIRDEERNTIEERIAANEELGRILDEQEAKMLEQAANVVAAAKAQYDLDQNNVEAKRAYLEALNEQAAVEAQVEGFRSEYKANQLALDRERLDLINSEKQGLLDVAAVEAQTAIDAETDARKKMQLQEQLSKQQYDNQLADLERQKALHKEGTQAYQDMVNEIAVLEKERTAQTQEEGRKRADFERELQAQKVQLVSSALGSMKELSDAFLGADEKNAEKAFNINKKLSIAETLINTYSAVVGAMNAKGPDGLLPFYVRLANAAVAGVTGLANVKKIASTTFDSGSMGSADVPSVTNQQSASFGPSISTIGDTAQTQLSDALGKPVRAYVTQTDINSGSALDRKILQNATFG